MNNRGQTSEQAWTTSQELYMLLFVQSSCKIAVTISSSLSLYTTNKTVLSTKISHCAVYLGHLGCGSMM